MEGRYALIRLVITQKGGGIILYSALLASQRHQAVVLEIRPSDGQPDRAWTGRVKIG